MDRGAWWATVHGVTKSQTQLSAHTHPVTGMLLVSGQPTLAVLPGKSHGERSLAGYSPWGHKESDVTEGLTHTDLIGLLLF